MDDMQKLDQILREIDSIKERLAVHERAASQVTILPDDQDQLIGAPLQPGPVIRPQPNPAVSPLRQSRFKREGLENLIGKSLLNRIGIIVLLAMAYFLKYSFDNNWIGPLGRIVIGYVLGAGFLIAGDILMRRGYNYFSQGISGGGISIIYLATFAAVSFYHLISSPLAFVLLVLIALSGGLLAVRQNALGLVFIATLGGFMTPFLMKPVLPLIDIHSANACLSIAGFAFASFYIFSSDFSLPPHTFFGWAGALGAVGLSRYCLSWEVSNALKYFHLDFSYNFLLSLTWVVLAVILILVGACGCGFGHFVHQKYAQSFITFFHNIEELSFKFKCLKG